MTADVYNARLVVTFTFFVLELSAMLVLVTYIE